MVVLVVLVVVLLVVLLLLLLLVLLVLVLVLQAVLPRPPWALGRVLLLLLLLAARPPWRRTRPGLEAPQARATLDAIRQSRGLAAEAGEARQQPLAHGP
jgi:hypothetical protein